MLNASTINIADGVATPFDTQKPCIIREFLHAAPQESSSVNRDRLVLLGSDEIKAPESGKGSFFSHQVFR